MKTLAKYKLHIPGEIAQTQFVKNNSNDISPSILVDNNSDCPLCKLHVQQNTVNRSCFIFHIPHKNTLF